MPEDPMIELGAIVPLPRRRTAAVEAMVTLHRAITLMVRARMPPDGIVRIDLPVHAVLAPATLGVLQEVLRPLLLDHPVERARAERVRRSWLRLGFDLQPWPAAKPLGFSDALTLMRRALAEEFPALAGCAPCAGGPDRAHGDLP